MVAKYNKAISTGKTRPREPAQKNRLSDFGYQVSLPIFFNRFQTRMEPPQATDVSQYLSRRDLLEWAAIIAVMAQRQRAITARVHPINLDVGFAAT